MSRIYRLMYLVGFSPWDTGEVPAELSELVEGSEALPAGRALDIGCGTGTQAVYLASRGWAVMGIDAVERPLRRARARSAAGGVSVTWMRGDASRLEQAGLQPGINLFFDRGCFHGLNDRQRASYASGVTALAAPGATLLLMSFAPNNVLVAPTGADEPEIIKAFGEWELESSTGDTGPDPDGPLKNVPRRWYRLTRRS